MSQEEMARKDSLKVHLQKAISTNPAFQENAMNDEDFKYLYEDEDFLKITL